MNMFDAISTLVKKSQSDAGFRSVVKCFVIALTFGLVSWGSAGQVQASHSVRITDLSIGGSLTGGPFTAESTSSSVFTFNDHLITSGSFNLSGNLIGGTLGGFARGTFMLIGGIPDLSIPIPDGTTLLEGTLTTWVVAPPGFIPGALEFSIGLAPSLPNPLHFGDPPSMGSGISFDPDKIFHGGELVNASASLGDSGEPIPEPSSVVLLMTGVVVFSLVFRWRLAEHNKKLRSGVGRS
jgi:hypothetical protein